MTKQLSNISSEATELTNTTGTRSPILEIQPDDGLVFLIDAMVSRGNEMGIPIFAELKDSNDDDLPQDTEIALEFETPNDDQAYAVTEPKQNIRAYNSLSVKDQQNEEYIDAIKHVLKGQGLAVEDVDKLYVSIDSSEQIDWSNSRLTISENAVQEV
jgi:hypothetical protein